MDLFVDKKTLAGLSKWSLFYLEEFWPGSGLPCFAVEQGCTEVGLACMSCRLVCTGCRLACMVYGSVCMEVRSACTDVRLACMEVELVCTGCSLICMVCGLVCIEVRSACTNVGLASPGFIRRCRAQRYVLNGKDQRPWASRYHLLNLFLVCRKNLKIF